MQTNRRRGFSAMLLVLGAAFLMTIWALSQHFTQTSIRKRVRIAEGGRRSLILAASAIEEGLESVMAEANEPPPEDAEADATLGAKMRAMAPGDVLDFSFEPARTKESQLEDDLRISKVTGQAYLLGVYARDGAPPNDFPCKKYKQYLVKWSQVPG